MIIKASATLRQNYNDIVSLCKETKEPVFLTKKVMRSLWIWKHLIAEKKFWSFERTC